MRQVRFLVYEQDDLPETPKVDVFPRLQRVLQKEVAHTVECGGLSDSQTHPVAVVFPDDPSSKKPFELMEDLDVPFVLHDDKFGQHLKAERHLGVFVEADMKTAFSVDKADHPVCGKFHRKNSDIWRIVSEDPCLD